MAWGVGCGGGSIACDFIFPRKRRLLSGSKPVVVAAVSSGESNERVDVC